tara:strand:- start:300 stop:878 length:579 start_codon:yes stop_codon:yes gene_type:complete
MKQSTGKTKNNIAVFISGRGSNFRSLIKYSKLKKSKFKIKLVVSSKKEAKGLLYAKKNNINYFVSNYKIKKNPEKKILLLLKKEKIKIICLAGYMKILSSNFINRFKGKILNIHPSLLPKYKGLNTHEKAINNRDKYSGFTIHIVNKKLDSGKIVFQKKIKISNHDNAKLLENKIRKQENKYYPVILDKFIN